MQMHNFLVLEVVDCLTFCEVCLSLIAIWIIVFIDISNGTFAPVSKPGLKLLFPDH